MKKRLLVAIGLSLVFAATSASAADEKTSFFITSVGSGDGGNLGGLEGADAHCSTLAEAAGVKGKTWRAYLSTHIAEKRKGDINARDRIGSGPWYNAKGVLIAKDVEQLHDEKTTGLSKENSLDESGELVNGRGDKPNKHDVMTGSQANGMAISGLNLTCHNWTSNKDDIGHSAQVGHHDRTGGGPNPKQWNSAHASKGCSLPTLQSTGGNGLFYCFAEK